MIYNIKLASVFLMSIKNPCMGVFCESLCLLVRVKSVCISALLVQMISNTILRSNISWEYISMIQISLQNSVTEESFPEEVVTRGGWQ